MSRIRTVYEQGRAAFLRGVPPCSPYLRHLPEDEAWLAGWYDAAGVEPDADQPMVKDGHLQHDLLNGPGMAGT